MEMTNEKRLERAFYQANVELKKSSMADRYFVYDGETNLLLGKEIWGDKYNLLDFVSLEQDENGASHFGFLRCDGLRKLEEYSTFDNASDIMAIMEDFVEVTIVDDIHLILHDAYDAYDPFEKGAPCPPFGNCEAVFEYEDALRESASKGNKEAANLLDDLKEKFDSLHFVCFTHNEAYASIDLNKVYELQEARKSKSAVKETPTVERD